MKIRISKLDQLFSEYIRKRANNKCEYGGEYREFKKLQCSHFYGRRAKSVRFDPDNASALCMYHHQWLGEHPLEHVEWFKKRLGEKGFKNLTLRENLTNKIDEKALMLYYEQELKKYGI